MPAQVYSHLHPPLVIGHAGIPFPKKFVVFGLCLGAELGNEKFFVDCITTFARQAQEVEGSIAGVLLDSRLRIQC